MLFTDEDIDNAIKALKDRKEKLMTLRKLADEVTALEVMHIPAAADLRDGVKIIQVTVTNHFGISMAQLVDNRKFEWIARPRMVAMHFCVHVLGAGLSETGRMFHRDHGTVSHACARVKEMMDTEPAFKRELEEVEKKCRAALAGSVADKSIE